jgi:3-dehydroquinate synthase
MSAIMTRVLHQAFAVSFDYPVVFTRAAFDPANRALVDMLDRRGDTRVHRVVVMIDGDVAAAWPDLPAQIERYAAAHAARFELAAPPRIVPGGERIKNDPAQVEDLIRRLVDLHMDRQSYVLAIGGGAVLDAVGYAAALVHRGLRLVRLPTTVLAQNDAGVGVKNAINWRGAKNMLGTFAPPFAVINDLDFLRTLPERSWIDGIAEAFKVAIIKDAAFFRELCGLAPALRARDEAAMERLVVRCAELHLEHIRGGGDPFEYGRARPLDFGHWSAHRLEILSDFALSHGQAVAIGVALDSLYAGLKGWLRPEDVADIRSGLAACGFALWHDVLARREAGGQLALLRGLEDFREHLGGELCVTMPDGLGRKFEVHELDPALVEEAVRRLAPGARVGQGATPRTSR